MEEKKPTEETPATPAGEAAPADKAPESKIDPSKPDSLIGQPLEKVQAACDAAGVRHRVVEVDGEPRAVTRDYMPERLNFKVDGGMVTRVTKG